MKKLPLILVLGSLAAGAVAGWIAKPKKQKPIQDIQEGDMVQWESRGAFVFSEPRKVSRVHESDMGIYVFVEESDTGIPVDQVVLIRRP